MLVRSCTPAAGSSKNITPKLEAATSKTPLHSAGSAWPSARTVSSITRPAERSNRTDGRAFRQSSIRSEKSVAVTCAPRSIAASTETAPLPEATSRSCLPLSSPARSRSAAAKLDVNGSMRLAYSPATASQASAISRAHAQRS